MNKHILEIGAWSTFFLQFVSNNIAIIAGLSSVFLSFTGIILNLIKINKEKQNNEKTN